jgi:hypothetical protein
LLVAREGARGRARAGLEVLAELAILGEELFDPLREL